MSSSPSPDSTIAGRQILFTVFCPALNSNVILFTETWERHILRHKTGPGFIYLKSKLELVKKAVASVKDTGSFFRYGNSDKSEWFMDFECPDFRPIADFLRIAFKRLEDGTIIIASAYKETRGILSYDS